MATRQKGKPPTDVKSVLICEDCGRGFAAPQNLARHRSAMHPIQEHEDKRDWGGARNSKEAEPPDEGTPPNLNMLGVVRNRIEAADEELVNVKKRHLELEAELTWLRSLEELIQAGPTSVPS